MTVKQLRKECAKKKLKQKGSKPEIIIRLINDFKTNNNYISDENDPSSDAPSEVEDTPKKPPKKEGSVIGQKKAMSTAPVIQIAAPKALKIRAPPTHQKIQKPPDRRNPKNRNSHLNIPKKHSQFSPERIMMFWYG